MAERRNTRQRQMVLDAVRHLGNHPTASDVYSFVHMKDEHVSLGTVYRNLNLLAEDGVLLSLHGMGEVRFDHRTDDHAHHVCTRCGAVHDIDLPYDAALDKEVSRQTGLAVQSHRTMFLGICANCA